MLDPNELRGYKSSLDPLTVQLNPDLAEIERRMFRLERIEFSLRRMLTDLYLDTDSPRKDIPIQMLEKILYEEKP